MKSDEDNIVLNDIKNNIKKFTIYWYQFRLWKYSFTKLSIPAALPFFIASIISLSVIDPFKRLFCHMNLKLFLKTSLDLEKGSLLQIIYLLCMLWCLLCFSLGKKLYCTFVDLVNRNNFKFIWQKGKSSINYRCKKLSKATYESNSPVIIRIIYFTFIFIVKHDINGKCVKMIYNMHDNIKYCVLYNDK
jgi:hypothetical protein